VAQAVTAALTEPVPAPERMFDHLYATMPPALQAQRRELRAHLDGLGNTDADAARKGQAHGQ